MKNRIQELAEQAGLLGPSSRVGKAHEAAEKFAALIIAECAKMCVPPMQEPVAKYSDIVSDGGLDPRNTAQPKPDLTDLTDADRKSYQAGHNAGVAHHKQAAKHKEWVGLTPDETYEFLHYATDKTWELVKSIEAKLKELNHD